MPLVSSSLSVDWIDGATYSQDFQLGFCSLSRPYRVMRLFLTFTSSSRHVIARDWCSGHIVENTCHCHGETTLNRAASCELSVSSFLSASKIFLIVILLDSHCFLISYWSFREHLSRALPTEKIFYILQSIRSECLISDYPEELMLVTL